MEWEAPGPMPPLPPRGRPLELSCDVRDPRVESPSSNASLRLRPLTSDAAGMPPIFPDPRSRQRPTFLPQLSDDATSVPRLDDAPPDEDTDAFKQAMWAGQANILVTVRVRPPCAHDRDDHEIVRVLDNKLIVVLDKHPPSGHASPTRVVVDPLAVAAPRRSVAHGASGLRKLRNVASAHPGRITTTSKPSNNNNTTTSTTQPSGARSREKRYAFDYVFTRHDGQQTVYHHTTKFLIHGVLHGFNATVFAYGCTGAGKTYTMLGTPDEPGIMALTLDDLFQNIAKVHADPQAAVVYKVTVSFLEVYNENIRDLLVTPPPLGAVQLVTGGSGAATSEYLDLREDPVKGPVVAGISEVEASNAQEVMKLLRRGNKHRSQEATAANSVSSRSHAVLQVLVEQRDKNSSDESFGVDPARGGMMTSTVKYGKLSLVDLAGSERAAVTQNRGQRLIEGANINRSLLALGNCINALGEKSAGNTSGGFVPYRDSKLTRLLKDSLGGNCRTVMIANVSPSTASVEETLNTLKYANRAKNIKTTVTRNVLSVDHHLTEYAGVVAELKDEIASLRKQLVVQSGDMAAAPASSPRLFAARISPGRGGKDRRVDGSNSIPKPGDHQEDDDAWKHGKLAEARGYIVQCFQQRQQLRRNLLEIDHCIDELSRQLKRAAEATSPGPEEADGLAREKFSAKQTQCDEATTVLDQLLRNADDQQNDDKPANLSDDDMHHQRLEAGIRQLLHRKAQLVTQLERNQSVMDDFRAGIEQSPLFVTNELLRDVLLMEYRVGDLQVENALLSAKQMLKDHEMETLRGCRLGQKEPPALEPSVLCRNLAELPSLELPAPLAEMTRLLTASHTKRDQDERPEIHSTRSSTGFAFLDELRDRFYDRNKTQQLQSVNRANELKPSLNKDSGAISPRRQWGIHLNNTALPYIRLKKKIAAPTVVSTPLLTTTATRSGYASSPIDSEARTNPSPSTAAPYLKVLKHRRKLQHRNSSSSSSHKKLPGIQPLSS